VCEIAAFMTYSADGRIAYGVWKAPSYTEVIKGSAAEETCYIFRGGTQV